MAAPVLPISAERRQLTVLFCDLVGSTSLSARLDPEDMREIIGAYHRCCADQITKAGGYVAQYLGDGVLAYFGYPRAHEDDAERSVRAGLALLDAVPTLRAADNAILQIRVGIATGLVVVGDLIGEGDAQQRGIVGDTPNLAARLQAVAEAGQVVISHSTRRLTGGLFDYRDLGQVQIKGLPNPVQAWHVTTTSRLESRFEALHESELSTLVGREDELDLLLRRWRNAKTGEGQVLLLCGEPGIGKSRLSVALEERVESEPHTLMRYFCAPHKIDAAFYPFITQLQRAANFSHVTTPDGRLQQVATLLGSSLHDDELLLVADLLSIPLYGRPAHLSWAPQRKKQKTIEALLRQLELLARQRPVLMVFEDVQWIDPSSREMLDRIVDHVARLSVLLLITFRPEYKPNWIGQPHVTAVTLKRLDWRDGEILVQQLAGADALPHEILAEIVGRTDGVPLFIEELTKAVIEGRFGKGNGIPATLHSSLMARLDHLGTISKEIAQIGAAIGREFYYELISLVATHDERELRVGLEKLVVAGLLFRRGSPPSESFLFKHALVQDAAYGSLLRTTRRQLHARISSALLERFPDSAENQPELLAHHYEQAELHEAAVRFLHKAGERAIARSAIAEAVAQLRKGLALLARITGGDQRSLEAEIQLSLAGALMAAKGYAAAEAVEAYERASLLCEQIGDSNKLLRVRFGQWVQHHVRAEERLAIEVAQKLLGLAQQSAAAGNRSLAHCCMGCTSFHSGELAAAREHFEQSIALYDERAPPSLIVQDIIVTSHVYLSNAFVVLGHFQETRTQIESAYARATKLNHFPTLAFAHSVACRSYWVARDIRHLSTSAKALLSLATEQQLPFWIALAKVYCGWIEAQSGQTAVGISIIERGLAEFQAPGARFSESFLLGLLASAHVAAGHVEDAASLLRNALSSIEDTDERWFEAETHRLIGELALSGSSDWIGVETQAEKEFTKALEIARRQNARLWELRAATSLARLRREQGRRSEAHDLLAPIYGWFKEPFETPDLKDAKELLEELG